MSYYLEVQEDGTEIHVPKKKGPTRKGWVRNEEVPGEFIKEDENASSPRSKASYIYIRFDNESGDYANHKPVGRGRRSMGYVKFMDIDNELKLASGEILPKNANTETIPSEVGIFINKTQPATPLPGSGCNEEKVDFETLKKCLKSGRFEKDGSKHTFKLVDVVGDPKIPYLRQNRAVSRIEVDTETGDVSVWSIEYVPDHPDVLISGIVR